MSVSSSRDGTGVDVQSETAGMGVRYSDVSDEFLSDPALHIHDSI